MKHVHSAPSSAAPPHCFWLIVVFQLKGETEEVRKQLSELVEGNANASKTMENIREPWKEKLQLTVDRLDNLFSEYVKE